MPTTKQPGPECPASDLPGAPLDMQARAIALELAAIFAAERAIARWVSGKSNVPMPTAPPAREPARARWYAQVQKNFQEWLDRGGFSQPDDAAQAAPAKLPATPDADAPREQAKNRARASLN